LLWAVRPRGGELSACGVGKGKGKGPFGVQGDLSLGCGGEAEILGLMVRNLAGKGVETADTGS